MNRLWTIYFNPKDYPGLYVVREWIIDGGVPRAGHVGAITRRIEIARASIPPEAVCLARSPSDDPVIVESWI